MGDDIIIKKNKKGEEVIVKRDFFGIEVEQGKLHKGLTSGRTISMFNKIKVDNPGSMFENSDRKTEVNGQKGVFEKNYRTGEWKFKADRALSSCPPDKNLEERVKSSGSSSENYSYESYGGDNASTKDSEQRYDTHLSFPGALFEIAGSFMKVLCLKSFSKFFFKTAAYIYLVKDDYYTSARCAKDAGDIEWAVVAYFNASSPNCPRPSSKEFKDYALENSIELCLENKMPKAAIKFLFMRDEYRRAANIAEQNNMPELAYAIYGCARRESGKEWEKKYMEEEEARIKGMLKKEIKGYEYLSKIYHDTEIENSWHLL